MTPADWKIVSELFGSALEMPRDARADFLRAQTQDNLSLFREVESLLAAHEESPNFLSKPAVSLVARAVLASSSPTAQTTEQLPGAKLGDFEVVRTLGRGSLATVYLARQLSLGREVALKVSADVGDEGKTMASLDHDHIVPVYSETVESSLDVRLICMPYVRGVNLETIIAHLPGESRTGLKGGDILKVVDERAIEAPVFAPGLSKERDKLTQLPFEEAVARLGLKVAEALCYAHARRVLHLDIKPANILLDHYGRPYLADFNVARSESGGVTQHAVRGGTPLYMSPEHREAFGSANKGLFDFVDERSDVYSLGLVLWELLYGELPGADELPLSEYATNADMPAELGDILKRCLRHDPAARFQTVEGLIRALEGHLDMRRMVRNIPPPGRLTKFGFRYPVTALIAVPMVPQLLGTTVASAYARTYTGIQLRPTEKAHMQRIGKIYPMISYPTALILSLLIVVPLAARFRNRRSLVDEESPERLARLRQRALDMPVWRAGINSTTWLFTIPVFQYVAYRMGREAPWISPHFVTTILLAWLIATIYSAMYNLYFSVRIFYPRFLGASPGIRHAVYGELSGVAKWIRAFPVLTLLIPLCAAMNLIIVGPGEFSSERYQGFQVLLLSIMGCSIGGFLLTLKVMGELSRVVSALRGPKPISEKS